VTVKKGAVRFYLIISLFIRFFIGMPDDSMRKGRNTWHTCKAQLK